MTVGLLHSHSGLAYLLVISAAISVVVAGVNLARPSPALVRVGTILTRAVETSLVGLVGLLGIALWYAMKLPIGMPYLWAGVVGVAVASVLAARGTKPALRGLAAGRAELAPRWLGFAVLQLLLVAGLTALMHAR